MSCHKAKTGQVACSDRREEIGNMFFFGKRYYPPPSSSSAFTLTFFLLFLFPQLFVNIYKMPRIEMTRWRPVKKKKKKTILFFRIHVLFFLSSPYFANARVAPLKWLIFQTMIARSSSSSRSADLYSFRKKLIRFRRNC